MQLGTVQRIDRALCLRINSCDLAKRCRVGLKFIGEVGVYIPARSAIKITALDGDRIVDCYARRSALEALGCHAVTDAREMIHQFQRHREAIEVAAQVKYRRALAPMLQVDVTAADLAALQPASAA